MLDQANRIGARYSPTWPLAAVLAPTTVIACSLPVAGRGLFVEMLAPDGLIVDNPTRHQGALDVTLLAYGAVLAGVVLWSFWIALAVASVPALTATWLPNTPLGGYVAGGARAWAAPRAAGPDDRHASRGGPRVL